MVKVRFAPSPTGYLHVGSARTALFNWLFARHEGGQFFLRVEDTDLVRSKPEFLEEIIDSLKWLGLNWDNSTLEYQSKRLDKYRAKADELLQKGLAYKDGEATIFKITPGQIVAFDDVVHGPVQFNTLEIKDQVLIKSDGMPTYNFACVIDDSDFGITHVIRGDDHISNTPKQIILYQAMNLPIPKFVHIPLILGTDRSRLSKRHGATSIREYKNAGFLSEAMVNFLSLLGWSPGQDREILPIEEIIKEFDLKRIGKTGAMFDLTKLSWMNSQYLQKMPLDQLLPLAKQALAARGWLSDKLDPAWVSQVVDLYKTRIETIEDFCKQTQGLFTDEIPFDPEAVALRLKQPGVADRLVKYSAKLETLPKWDTPSIEAACRSLAAELGLKAADLIHPARVAVTGRSVGPSLFHVLEVAGKERTISRLKSASATLCAL
jgi:glutamyl-tRNA synthetase